MENGDSGYARFLRGDESALTELVKTYRGSLTNYLFSIVHDRDLAEDLAEDTFVKLLVKRPPLRKDASFKTWLYTVGRNLALDHLRKTKRRNEVGEEPLAFAEAAVGDPAALLIEKEERKALLAAMERLRPSYRQILQLSCFEGFGVGECARILKKEKRAVSVLLHRAREALKKEMTKEEIIP